MTTQVTVVPAQHPILVTTNMHHQEGGLTFASLTQNLLMPDDPRKIFHISKGTSISVEELEPTDPRVLAEALKRDPTNQTKIAQLDGMAPHD